VKSLKLLFSWHSIGPTIERNEPCTRKFSQGKLVVLRAVRDSSIAIYKLLFTVIKNA